MKYVENLTNLSLRDTPQAGGKGASLGDMTKVGLPVPPGFVVLSLAFEEFLEKSNLNIQIDNLLYEVNTDRMSLEKISEQIQSLIKATKIPKNIVTEIQKAFKELGSDLVAVRSSATAEDSASATWAGQLESYLNITQEHLVDHVQKCWASLFTPRAIFYRLEKEFPEQKISVAVVIQKMIHAEVSGVAFSVHPVTQDTNTLIIEATSGLGESLVKGLVTPDTYIVERESRRITTSNTPVSLDRKHQLLSKQYILQLTDLILRIESHFGFPVDIEWALECEKIYITQSRPITTLQQIHEDMVLVGTRRTNQFEASLRAQAWSDGLVKELDCSFNVIVINSDGEHYVDKKSSEEINTLLQKKKVAEALEHIERMYAIRKKLLKNIQDTTRVDLSEMLITLFTDFFIAQRIAEYSYEKADLKTQKQIDQWRNDTTIFEPLDILEKQYLQKDANYTWSIVNVHGQQKIIPKKIQWQQETIHEYRPLLTRDILLFEAHFWYHGENEGLRKLTNGRMFFQPLFMHKADMGVQVFYDYTDPTQDGLRLTNYIHENAKIFSQMVKEHDAVVTRLNHAVEKQDTTFSALMELSLEFWPLLVCMNLLSGRLREYVNDDIVKRASTLRTENDTLIYDVVRKLAILANKKLPTEFQNFVHLLTYEEIKEEVWPSIKELHKREKQYVYYQGKVYCPRSIKEFEKRNDLIFIHKDGENNQEIKGASACKGIARGAVKIIFEGAQMDKVMEGDVLVSPMTTPDFLPAMKKAVAFVTDEGGITSHAAIIAREMNKPCIVGTKNASRILQNGMFVEVDANRGIVKILDVKS